MTTVKTIADVIYDGLLPVHPSFDTVFTSDSPGLRLSGSSGKSDALYWALRESYGCPWTDCGESSNPCLPPTAVGSVFTSVTGPTTHQSLLRYLLRQKDVKCKGDVQKARDRQRQRGKLAGEATHWPMACGFDEKTSVALYWASCHGTSVDATLLISSATHAAAGHHPGAGHIDQLCNGEWVKPRAAGLRVRVRTVSCVCARARVYTYVYVRARASGAARRATRPRTRIRTLQRVRGRYTRTRRYRTYARDCNLGNRTTWALAISPHL